MFDMALLKKVNKVRHGPVKSKFDMVLLKHTQYI